MSQTGPRVRPRHLRDAEPDRLHHHGPAHPHTHAAPLYPRRPLGRRGLLRLSEVLGILAVLAVAAWLALEIFSPWPPFMTIRHIMAAPSCERAATVGLVPSLRGQPGYWERHDRDGDGWACESPVYR